MTLEINWKNKKIRIQLQSTAYSVSLKHNNTNDFQMDRIMVYKEWLDEKGHTYYADILWRVR